MILDGSALTTIMLDKPERSAFESAIVRSRRRVMSVVAYLEAMTAVQAVYGHEGALLLDEMAATLKIDIQPFSRAQMVEAKRAMEILTERQRSVSFVIRLTPGECATFAQAAVTKDAALYDSDALRLTGLRRVALEEPMAA
ncbi:MAG: type II toxin-antitoxin system VapC family toxin [Pseudomonadota bacterium]